MAHICSSVEIASVSRDQSFTDLHRDYESSFFVSPSLPDQRDCLASALHRAFGHRKQFISELMSLQVPTKRYVELYLLQMHRSNFKWLTIRQSFSTIRRFLGFFHTRDKVRVEQVSRCDLEAFVEYEQDRGLKLSTVRTVLARVYAFLSFLVDQEVMAPDVVVRKVKLRLPQYLPKAMDPEDVKRLLCVIKDIRDRAMVLVLLRSGMRIGELLSTRVGELNMKQRSITIFEGRKNRRGRVVYFSDDARDALRAWLKSREPQMQYLFHSRGRDGLCYGSCRTMFEKYLKQAGLGEKGYSLHSLRHTFASELLNARMRLEYLQELLGHDSIEVTRRYARLTDKSREEEYFRAMGRIERGEIDGHYRLDRQLQEILEEKELFGPYGQKLYGQP